MVNAQSKTNAIGWTMFANMFSGKDSAKMHWADILPFKVPGLDTDDHVMPIATEKTLRRLISQDKIPKWAATIAKRLPTINKE